MPNHWRASLRSWAVLPTGICRSLPQQGLNAQILDVLNMAKILRQKWETKRTRDDGNREVILSNRMIGGQILKPVTNFDMIGDDKLGIV